MKTNTPFNIIFFKKNLQYFQKSNEFKRFKNKLSLKNKEYIFNIFFIEKNAVILKLIDYKS